MQCLFCNRKKYFELHDYLYSDNNKFVEFLNSVHQEKLSSLNCYDLDAEKQIKKEIIKISIKNVNQNKRLTKDNKKELIQNYSEKESITVYGCKHYKKKCLILAECCNKYYTCRLCHDECEAHQIDRLKIKTVKCLLCDTIQNISNKCIKCNTEFARYYCDICHFYNDDINIDIYHCIKCSICRVGKKEDYIHCDKCEGCFYKTGHICIEKNVKSNCPICFESIFDSRESSTVMRCGHIIHKSCLSLYLENNYICPFCSKSIYDATEYYKSIDEFLKNEVLPQEFDGLYNLIYCSDCEKKCYAKFHFKYHKCSLCKGYNTIVVKSRPKEESPCEDDIKK